jgi:hypothetical protein
MSWLFSQALVAEYSGATSWDGAPSAPLSMMPTPHRFSRNDKPMEPCHLSRFGLTCAVLTADRGEALLTWYRAGFPARTSQLQAAAPASTAVAQVCGARWHESSVRFDPIAYCWRTHRCLWAEDLPWSSVTLPSWGMTLDGVVFQRQTAERPISVTASGLWPTPAVQGNTTQPKKRRRRAPSTTYAWPTPVASMCKGSSPRSLTRRSGASRARDRLDHAVMACDHGHLNPTWVEWLMGWPTGWTDLKPLAMDKFREWQLQHSNCCVAKTNDKEAA